MTFQQLMISATIVGLVASRSVHVDDPELDELWLADFDGGNAARYADYVDGMQADAPVVTSDRKSHVRDYEESWVCPPPPEDKSKEDYCGMTKCKGDSECKQAHQNCCFNGCVYTCLNTLPPPPLVDWIKEPPRRLLAGNSWLVPGPEMSSPGESCSTDFDIAQEDALLCAHGYICHITYPGDAIKGIPNRGKCIKDNDNVAYKGPRRFRLATSDKDSNPNACVFENAIFAEGSRFRYQHHMCECLKNTITCTVGEDEYDRMDEDYIDDDSDVLYNDYDEEDGLLDPID